LAQFGTSLRRRTHSPRCAAARAARDACRFA
jgi:hypothetical protein